MDAGFVGLGSMGQPMARSLVRAGHRLTVWNRTRPRAEAVAKDGATLGADPADAARTGVVLSMVSDDRALEAVSFGPSGILVGLPAGGVHVSMSTISLDLATRLVQAHGERGQVLVSAPVFGRPEAAAAAKLFVLAAGPREGVERARPLLEAVGQRVFPLGEEPAHANLVKLAGNFLITAAIEAFAEAAVVVGKGGVDRHAFLEVLLETLFGAPIYRTYGPRVLDEQFSPPGFALPLGLKDNRLLLQAGELLEAPLPLASLVRDRMLAALARGYGEEDWSAFARIAREEAGIDRAPGASARAPMRGG
jgi:3-hydroxyisobutyrate dehydrogenase-like beta-hydroxyacid dehydrogenase